MAKRDDVTKLCATAVDKYVQARNLSMLPDRDTERVLGMAGGEAGQNLCQTFKTFYLQGRFSRTMMEQALSFSPTSYSEYIQLWVRSLPPMARSAYAARLYESNFEGIEWDTPLYENLQRFIQQYESSHPFEHHKPAIQPAIPLGDNRHTPRMAYISKVSFDFYAILDSTVLFNTGRGPADDVYAPLDPNYADMIECDGLEEHGPLFGFSKSDMDWSGARSDTGRSMSTSEIVVRAWNVLYFSDRLAKTELEDALVNGPAAMKSLFSTAVQLSRSLYGNPRFADILDQALAVLDSVEFTALNIPADAAPYWECDYCGEQHDNMSMCSRCHVAAYCSRNCQKLDWRRHKPLCTRYMNAQPT